MTAISLPGESDKRGDLWWVEGGNTIPFEIKRVFYIANVPPHESRGGHAHRTCHQFIIPIHGQFQMRVDDGSRNENLLLQSSWRGVHIKPMVWCELTDFMEGTACLVLASEHYDENDYIRDYSIFLKEVGR